MILFFLFAFITLATNGGLWWWYHQKSIRQAKDYLSELTKANKLNKEILRRCEQYRTAAVTEALAAKMRTQPVIKVYPIQRRNMTWIIENHLN